MFEERTIGVILMFKVFTFRFIADFVTAQATGQHGTNAPSVK